MIQQGISQKKPHALQGRSGFFLRNSETVLDVSATNLFLCEEKEEKIRRNQLSYLIHPSTR